MSNEDFLCWITEGHKILTAWPYFADARLERVHVTQFSSDESGCITVKQRLRQGIGVRVRIQGRWGFAAIEGNISWKEILARAERIASSLPEHAALPFANAVPITQIDEIPASCSSFSPEKLSELVDAVYGTIPGANCVRLHAVIECGLRGVVSSEGTLAVRPVIRRSLALSIQIRCHNGRILGVPIGTSSSVTDDQVHEIRGQLGVARDLAIRLASARSLSARECPVVLGPACTGYFVHEAFGHLCEADRVPCDRINNLPLGFVVGPRDLEIWDRADVVGASGSLPFDDEGVPCQPAVLVSRGRWIGLLHSRETAGIFGLPPTGNARVTSFRFPPRCRMRLTEVKPGPWHRDALISSVPDGLYIDCPYGGHVRGSVFQLVAVDVRRICKGRLAEPYAGGVLIGEPLAILRKIDAIASDASLIDGLGTCSREDQKDLPVSMLAPTVLLRSAFVAPL
jgi:TldD protein